MMMRKITVAQIKGGVGKTSVTVHLARALAIRGKKVLVIDLDPQANTSRFLGLSEDVRGGSIGEVLVRRFGKTLEEIVQASNAENVWIAPACLGMSKLTSEFERDGHRLRVLSRGLDELSRSYDFCLIDTNPGVNAFTEAGLAAADLVLGPLPPEGQADQGFVDLRSVLGELNEFSDSPAAIVGVVTKWDSRTRKTHGVYWRQVKGGEIPLLESRIQKSEIVNQAGMLGMTAFDLQKNHPVCGSFKDLADELITIFAEPADEEGPQHGS